MKEVMTKDELIEYLDISETTLRKLEELGLRPARMTQKLKFFRRDEILRFMESRENITKW